MRLFSDAKATTPFCIASPHVGEASHCSVPPQAAMDNICYAFIAISLLVIWKLIEYQFCSIAVSHSHTHRDPSMKDSPISSKLTTICSIFLAYIRNFECTCCHKNKLCHNIYTFHEDKTSRRGWMWQCHTTCVIQIPLPKMERQKHHFRKRTWSNRVHL
jgi:hypothetical protein